MDEKSNSVVSELTLGDSVALEKSLAASQVNASSQGQGEVSVEVPDQGQKSGLRALGLNPNMAVMKTFCGCLSTKSGTMAILMVYSLLTIAAIIGISVQLSNDKLETWVNDEMNKEENDCRVGEHKDSWWCKAAHNFKDGTKEIMIVSIVIYVLLLILSIVAIVGTSKGKHLLLLPWIIFKFILLLFIMAVAITVIIIMSVYVSKDDDTGNTITVGVVSAAGMAFLFYLWLCVVSHFQILREVSKLGLGNMDNVHKFVNEDSESVMEPQSMDYSPDLEPSRPTTAPDVTPAPVLNDVEQYT